MDIFSLETAKALARPLENPAGKLLLALSGSVDTSLEKLYRSPIDLKAAGVRMRLSRSSELKLSMWCPFPSLYEMLKGQDSTMGTATAPH